MKLEPASSCKRGITVRKIAHARRDRERRTDRQTDTVERTKRDRLQEDCTQA